jgi:hypothetical protein
MEAVIDHAFACRHCRLEPRRQAQSEAPAADRLVGDAGGVGDETEGSSQGKAALDHQSIEAARAAPQAAGHHRTGEVPARSLDAVAHAEAHRQRHVATFPRQQHQPRQHEGEVCRRARSGNSPRRGNRRGGRAARGSLPAGGQNRHPSARGRAASWRQCPGIVGDVEIGDLGAEFVEREEIEAREGAAWVKLAAGELARE